MKNDNERCVHGKDRECGFCRFVNRHCVGDTPDYCSSYEWPKIVMSDWGEPWYLNDRGLIRLNGGGLPFGEGIYEKRAIDCVNALAGRDPDALAELEERIENAISTLAFYAPLASERLKNALAKFRGKT